MGLFGAMTKGFFNEAKWGGLIEKAFSTVEKLPNPATKEFWIGSFGKKYGFKASLALAGLMVAPPLLASAGYKLLYADYGAYGLPPPMPTFYQNFPMAFGGGMNSMQQRVTGSLAFNLHNLRKG